jgi:hypothetical protein
MMKVCPNAKLTELQVQQIRAFHANGFQARCLSEAFGVCHRSILNIIRGRHWHWLPVQPVELPTLCPDAAKRLRLRTVKKLNAEQRAIIDAYRAHLAASIDNGAEREGFAILLMNSWKPRQPAGRGKRDRAKVMVKE